MRFSPVLLAGSAAAAPFMFPLRNGFPTPSDDAIAKIEYQAGGTLPNGALPSKLSPTAIATFTLVAAQETFEVGFFTSLYNNITGGAYGGQSKLIQETIRAIRAQEELHALGANALLKGAGAPTVPACEYYFTTTTFDDAIGLAATFTDVVLATLQTVVATLSADGGQEPALLPLVTSIAEQEGEQVGLFRFLQNKYASSAPFLTTNPSPTFAWSALKMFIVPGSCAKVEASIEKAVGSFPALTIANPPGQADSALHYTAAVSGVSASTHSLVYITGQRLPLTVPITAVKSSGGSTTFTANFPFTEGFSKGLTIAALVKGTGQLASLTDVAPATVAGPGLIEV